MLSQCAGVVLLGRSRKSGHENFPLFEFVTRTVFRFPTRQGHPRQGPPTTLSKAYPMSTMRSTFSTSLFRQAASRRAGPSFVARRFASSQTSQGASPKQVQDALGAAQRLLASAGRVLGPLGEKAAGLLGCAY